MKRLSRNVVPLGSSSFAATSAASFHPQHQQHAPPQPAYAHGGAFPPPPPAYPYGPPHALNAPPAQFPQQYPYPQHAPPQHGPARTRAVGSLAALFLPLPPPSRVVYVVPQGQVWVVERLGKFNRVLEAGTHMVLPGMDRVRYVCNAKDIIASFTLPTLVTLDGAMVDVEGTLTFRLEDARQAAYNMTDPVLFLSELGQMVLRSQAATMRLRELVSATVAAPLKASPQDEETAAGGKVQEKSEEKPEEDASAKSGEKQGDESKAESEGSAKQEEAAADEQPAKVEAFPFIPPSVLGEAVRGVLNGALAGIRCVRCDVVHLHLVGSGAAAALHATPSAEGSDKQSKRPAAATTATSASAAAPAGPSTARPDSELQRRLAAVSADCEAHRLWAEAMAKSIDIVAKSIQANASSGEAAAKFVADALNSSK